MVRGPAPKRDSQRHRGNAPVVPTDVVPTDLVELDDYPPGNPLWDAVALQWYDSLPHGGVAKYYSRTDWAYAYAVADAMSRDLLRDGEMSSATKTLFVKANTDLLTTEGSRRRARIELVRASKGGVTPGGESPQPDELAAYRARFA